jgi:hypothetical protein
VTLQATIFWHLVIITLITLIFYGLVPLIGAFSVRNRWRQFRTQLMKASLRSSLTYGAVHGKGNTGPYRFFGSLQAIQDENILWLSDGNVSVSMDLSGVPVYILPAFSTDNSQERTGLYPDESAEKTYWNRIFSLPENTSIFVSGELLIKDGLPQFENTKEVPLTVVIYDGDTSDFYSHAILSGRQRNEYWNSLTPGTLTTGSFLLFIYFYILIKTPYMHFAAVTAVSFSLVPIIPFLPPGLVFYYIYRFFWKKARIIRAERDLLRLPLNFFSTKLSTKGFVSLKNGGSYKYVVKNKLEDALEVFEHIVFRKSSLLKSGLNTDSFYIFGSDSDNIEDPMAENLLIPGNPEHLVIQSTKTALKYELISVISFGFGFLLNLFLLLSAITLYLE